MVGTLITQKNETTTLPETNSWPLKMVVSNRNLLFQRSIFRGELLVSGANLPPSVTSPRREHGSPTRLLRSTMVTFNSSSSCSCEVGVQGEIEHVGAA